MCIDIRPSCSVRVQQLEWIGNANAKIMRMQRPRIREWRWPPPPPLPSTLVPYVSALQDMKHVWCPAGDQP